MIIIEAKPVQEGASGSKQLTFLEKGPENGGSFQKKIAEFPKD